MADYTRTYTIVLKPVRDGWLGYCLEIPECSETGPGKQAAYRAVKHAIRAYLRQQLSMGQLIPRRDTIIKHPRFDLRELGFEVRDIR